jgi:hypothetical protein
MLNLFGTANPTLDASDANANAKISTAQFLTITNVKHPAVQEMLDFGEVDFEFLSRDDYCDRRNHAYALWEVYYRSRRGSQAQTRPRHAPRPAARPKSRQPSASKAASASSSSRAKQHDTRETTS